MKKTNQNTTTTNTAAPTAAEETKALNLTDVENAPEDIVVEIDPETLQNDAETDEQTESAPKKYKKKGIVKRVTGWCKKHKKMLIIGGIVTGAAVGGYAYYRYNKKMIRKAERVFELPDAADKAIADLPIAEYASDAINNDGTWLADKMPDLKVLDRTGKTLLQNLPPVGDYSLVSRKIVDSTKEEISKAVLESLDNIIDNVDIDTIKSVSLLYDIT
ncbi:MAG: hypothetical protein J6U54_07215 [Clostridiales bacterium]|nr:hypothetical protein [Clostridiales bacterium]